MADATPIVSGLIIDDDPDARFLLGAQIRRTRLIPQIDIADCGEDAIDYFKLCLAGEIAWPCIVFLDIDMPGITGFDVLAWCRLQNVVAKTVVVMHSSATEPDKVSQAFSLGAHAFLGKYGREATVRELVRTALSFVPRNDKIAALGKFRPQ